MNNSPLGPPPPSLVTPTYEINSPGQKREPPTYQQPARVVVSSDPNTQICMAILDAVMQEIKRLQNRAGERPRGKRAGEKYILLVSLHGYLENLLPAIKRGDTKPIDLFTAPHPDRGKTLRYALEFRRHAFHKSPPKSAKILRHYDPETMVREATTFLQSAADRLERKAKKNGVNRYTNRQARKKKQLHDLIVALGNPELTRSIMTLQDLLKFRASDGSQYNLLQVLNQHRYGEENGPDKPADKDRKNTKTFQKFIEWFGVSEDASLILPVQQALETQPFGRQ